MKLAYVNFLGDCSQLSGVYNKIAGQKKACVEAGIDMDFLLFTYAPPKTQNANGITIVKLKHGKIARNLFAEVARAIVNQCAGFDAVILRSLGRSPLYPLCFANKPFILITEHHTLYFEELKVTRGFFSRAVQKASSRFCLKMSDGIICMTEEIAKDEARHGAAGAPALVCANGISVENIRQTGFAPFDGKTLNIAIVASHLLPWHGMDRLVESVRAYRGGVRFVLHIIGGVAPGSLKDPGSGNRFVFHGVLSGQQMDSALSLANIGASTLGLYTKGMQQACSLKSREYMARGLPFFYAYDDPDIPIDFPFCLKLENSPDLIDMGRVIDFCHSMNRQTQVSQKMRALAEEKMDWKGKMQQYQKFAHELVTKRSRA
ncbi:MAG: hypothetical protein QMD09_07905 [Desulfatibacillaceae bacterium]|nr:hypothetical protein [Desulfatibacillaceae bacterium]